MEGVYSPVRAAEEEEEVEEEAEEEEEESVSAKNVAMVVGFFLVLVFLSGFAN